MSFAMTRREAVAAVQLSALTATQFSVDVAACQISRAQAIANTIAAN